MADERALTPEVRVLKTAEAVGTVIAHDITEIVPGKFKGPAFKKGHVVTEADLPHLARLGKEHLYVLELGPGQMHEDEAALVLAEALTTGPGVTFSPTPSEGKINLVAAHDGLLKVNVAALTAFNLVDGVMCASRHTDTVVRAGEIVAGTRVIPLVIEEAVVRQAAALAQQAVTARQAGGVFEVRPLAPRAAALIITGNEVFSHRIEDRFAAALTPKLEAYGCSILSRVLAPDDVDFIARCIRQALDRGAELIVLTGGMSVDPDDVTRLGVLRAGGEDVVYGSSVLPGAMLLLARIGDVPVMGVPACAIHHRNTVFDLVLPRILAGERLSRTDLALLAHGGLCLGCEDCRFPRCPLGKGGG